LLGIATQIEDAFHAQDIGTALRDQGAKPRAHLHAVELAGLDNAYSGNVGEMFVVVMMVARGNPLRRLDA